MTWHSRVVWSEGLFLRSQHFQQADRYHDWSVRNSVTALRPYPWGFAGFQIDEDLLRVGKFGLSIARGLMRDGTFFAVPQDSQPAPIDVAPNVRNSLVYLTIPVSRSDAVEAGPVLSDQSLSRYVWENRETVDSNLGSDTSEEIRVGRLRVGYGSDTEDLSSFECLPVARVVEVRADKTVIIDPNFIPPLLTSAASPILVNYLRRLQSILKGRSEELSARIGGRNKLGVASSRDFMILLSVNRWLTPIRHYAALAGLPPYDLFGMLLAMLGEFATYGDPQCQPPEVPAYQHDNLQRCFEPVMSTLLGYLALLIEYTAIEIPLKVHSRYGIRVGMVQDRTLLESSGFILAVKAAVPEDRLRQQLPNHAKVGSVENIHELVNSALVGIPMIARSVAPRQLPYEPGTSYFELDRSSRYWADLKKSSAIAIHIAGDFPELEMRCWAIRESNA